MTDTFDTALIFGILALFQAVGGAALGASVRGRRLATGLWGGVVGAAPLYFGVERGLTMHAWAALAWQLTVLGAAALSVGLGLPHIRAFFLRPAMTTLTIGSFIMLAGILLGAWLSRAGAEFWSIIAGGLPFVFGAMWFGAGLKQLTRR